jgi:hypothetical protein
VGLFLWIARIFPYATYKHAMRIVVSENDPVQ